jgi:hypothetical protein
MADEKEVASEYSEVELSSGAIALVKRIPATHWYLFEMAWEPPPPPMRKAEAIGGVTEMVPDREDEEWLARCKELKQQETAALHEFVLDNVVMRDEPTPEVLAQLEKYGIEPTPRNFLLFNMEKHSVDFVKLRLESRRISRVTEDEVQKALDGFRSELGGPIATDTDGDSEEPVSSEE